MRRTITGETEIIATTEAEEDRITAIHLLRAPGEVVSRAANTLMRGWERKVQESGKIPEPK
ncbi:hypothetical protein [Streptomyces sp. ST2-7A]|uniref:hypothetical protein n=1 Tax=Streptomyces sp. ST2-7A TaxID=2907214 RepID=UPI001F333E76|nr:hypothetical protein [Streptomyces sp. ST2-7A]MCE7080661.1 hypothetical protein [Streptomyces sp. ST2-7A]